MVYLPDRNGPAGDQCCAGRRAADRSTPSRALLVELPQGVGGELHVFFDVEVEHPGNHEIGAVAEGMGKAMRGGIAPAAMTLNATQGFFTVSMKATVFSASRHHMLSW